MSSCWRGTGPGALMLRARHLADYDSEDGGTPSRRPPAPRTRIRRTFPIQRTRGTDVETTSLHAGTPTV